MSPATLTPQARREMATTSRAIARNNLSAALRFPSVVMDLAKRLGDFPDLGVERVEIVGSPYRFATVPGFPYLLVYNALRRPPVILRIVHAAHDLQAVLRDLPQSGA